MITKLVEMNRHLRIALLFSGFVFFILAMPFVGSFWFLSFMLSFSSIGLLIYTNSQYDKKYAGTMEKSLDKTLMQFEFSADDSYLSDDYLTGIAINQSHNKIALLKRNNTSDNFKLIQFNFDDILECSIVEDGETITKTSKGLAIGGALLASGTGAIVGSVLGNKNSSEQIVKATLSIVVNDISNPVHDVHFLNSKMLIDKNSEIYQNIYSEMNKWNKRISVILKRNELNSKLS